MSKGLFITGTGTDVGKTYISGLITKKLHEAGLNAGYYKAAMSGNVREETGGLIPGDARFVKRFSGISQPEAQMCPYVYEAACSPHLASRLEGNPVKRSVVLDSFRSVSEQYDYVTMEGSGGILCPITYDRERLWLWELVRDLKLPCLLIAEAGLGTINDVGLTAFFLRAKGIPLKGIVFNHYHPGNVLEEDNLHMCEELTGTKVLACVTDDAQVLELDIDILLSLYEGGAL